MLTQYSVLLRQMPTIAPQTIKKQVRDQRHVHIDLVGVI
jgi:hypothetical protein